MRALVIASCLLIAPATARAQVDAGITATALLSVQPIDDSFVGSPYLSEGIGGPGPAMGVGVDLMWRNGLTVAAEFSRAWYEQQQSGRLVLGPYPLDGVGATTELHDSLLFALTGYAIGSGPTRIRLVGGVAYRLDRPTVDNERRDDFGRDQDHLFPLAPTGGVDIMRSIGTRAALFLTARYTYLERDESLQYLGIGAHVLRAGGGLRVKLN